MIVLASASPTRKKLLENAGLNFVVEVSTLDEAVEKPSLQHLAPRDQAIRLAELKAQSVSKHRPSDLVIGSDQILEFNHQTTDKPMSYQNAFVQLSALQGNTHHLHSAAVCVIAGQTTFTSCQTVELKMREMTAENINQYLQAAGPQALACVGCYQIEGLGIQLFEAIKGDYFSILGLPLLPLLVHLRNSGHSVL